MIAFLTQYYRGLGHSQRIKFIAEEVGRKHDVLIIDQLFEPPLKYTVPHISFLRDYTPSDVNNISCTDLCDSMRNSKKRCICRCTIVRITTRLGRVPHVTRQS